MGKSVFILPALFEIGCFFSSEFACFMNSCDPNSNAHLMWLSASIYI